MHSEAFTIIATAAHPSPAEGGPCATCAFRQGTEANGSEHTTMLAMLCVEGVSPFRCHEQPHLCRGWIAAVNLLAADGGLPDDEASRRHRYVCAMASDVLGAAITNAADADRAAQKDGR